MKTRSKTKTLCGLAVFSIFWFATPASAVPVVDFIDPSPDILFDLGSSPAPCPAGFTCVTNTLSYEHDITDDGFSSGDTIASAVLEVRVYDSGGNEAYQYVLGAAAQTVAFGNIGEARTDTIVLNLPSLADLQADGKIAVSLAITVDNVTQPGFFFDWTRLTAQVTHNGAPPVPAPEPGTLLLLSSALGTLAWRFRRRAPLSQ